MIQEEGNRRHIKEFWERDGDPRAKTVKTTPGMTLHELGKQALEQSGKAKTSSPFNLRQGRTTLNSSLTVRQAHLPQGAKLTLSFTDGSTRAALVSVGLQVEGNPRVVDKFASTSTLQHILDSFHQSYPDGGMQGKVQSPSSPAQSTLPTWHAPALHILGRDYRGRDTLTGTTLQDLGLTQGNVGIRLIYYPSTEAPSIISPPVSTEGEITGKEGLRKKFMGIPPTRTDTPPVPPPSSSEPSPCPSTPDHPARATQVFQAPKAGNMGPLASKIELPDDFFTLTSAELKAELEAQKRRRSLGNQVISSKTKESMGKGRGDKGKKMFPRTLIRVRFPDQVQIQSTFSSSDTLSDVSEWVKSCLEVSETPVVLYTSPPKCIHRTEDPGSLLDRGFAPATLLYLLPSSSGQALNLKESMMEKAVPISLAREDGEEKDQGGC
ncbi:hypothetical protein BJ684DRAFT_14495 [Piptocephalis cylindrospora]|uniref:UBX domain-containing protein n=1 Tax=Piptocephalis cylindrospora TaxID=1907219 RepID=A0A4P9YAW4_9FUNG|nr:hypothetical protein BJ684DRAFT_14495 [Piptocephalis cylindrospora]|eukprot:RKP15250.1 hypothetical protein BJ684DRAFT_14495 [Piptocephalis cylindrospora]